MAINQDETGQEGFLWARKYGHSSTPCLLDVSSRVSCVSRERRAKMPERHSASKRPGKVPRHAMLTFGNVDDVPGFSYIPVLRFGV